MEKQSLTEFQQGWNSAMSLIQQQCEHIKVKRTPKQVVEEIQEEVNRQRSVVAEQSRQENKCRICGSAEAGIFVDSPLEYAHKRCVEKEQSVEL